MKKKLLCLIMLIFLLTGCFKRDDMEDIKIYTTLYPVHYLIDSLYGDNSDIFSVYPSGIDIDNYEFTSKQLNEYSRSGLFVFNSKRDTERDLAVDLINKNKNLKIIDSALGVNYTYSTEELWLNPYNYLMMAQNVKTGLEEYITNPYLIKEVDENYQSLKISLSELDAELKEVVKNSEYNTIVVDNDSFSFLEKYGLNIISLDNSNNQVTEKTISEVKLLLNRNKIKYIFSSSEEVNDIVTNLKDNYGATISVLNTMKSIDGGITNSNQSYLTIMKDNIDLIKKELYK